MPAERSYATRSYGSGWSGFRFGSVNHVLIKRITESIAQTGANVDTDFEIPYPHRFQHFELKHTNAAGVNNTTAMIYDFGRWKWSGATSPFSLWASPAAGVTVADVWRLGGEEYAFPAGKYRLRLNVATSGHLVFPELTIQILTKKGKELVKRGW